MAASRKPRKAAKKKTNGKARTRERAAPAVVAAVSEPAANPVGRPTKYSRELADRICAMLAEGLSMRTVCKTDGIPAMSTVFRWLRENEEFQEQYARAKEESADAFSEEILDIADNATNDFMEREIAEGIVTKVVDHEHISRSKLRVDTRKWLASKLKPKRYGDKLELEGKLLSEVRVVNMTGIKVGGGNA